MEQSLIDQNVAAQKEFQLESFKQKARFEALSRTKYITKRDSENHEQSLSGDETLLEAEKIYNWLINY